MIKFFVLFFMIGCANEKVCRVVCIPGEECIQKCKAVEEW